MHLWLFNLHYAICRLSVAFCRPGINASFEIGIGNEILVLESERQPSRCITTYGTLLNGSSSLESRTVRMVARSMTTRETGKITGSFITGTLA